MAPHAQIMEIWSVVLLFVAASLLAAIPLGFKVPVVVLDGTLLCNFL
jgi:hypothetical protein